MLWSVLLIIISLAVYAGLHSLTAASGVKAWARRVFGPASDRWYRLVYNIVAVVTFLPILLLVALLPDRLLYLVPSPWRWLMVAGQVLALGGLTAAVAQTNAWHFLGLAQLFDPQPAQTGRLVVSGLYRWVRHPIYFFSLLFLWLSPVMTLNQLTLYVMVTLYFYVGSIFEERRLEAEFGEAYRRYRQYTPRLFPLPGRSFPAGKEAE